jgi:hypothetical protein
LSEKVDKIKNNVESDINNKFENKIKEQKRKNVIVFKVPESKEKDPTKAYQEDFTTIIDAIDPDKKLKSEDITELFRIGEKDSEVIRPIIIKCGSSEIRTQILQLRNIYVNNKPKPSQIFFAADLTRQERDVRKKLVEELKERKKQGETNITIRNGKIVPTQPFRYKPQAFWGSRFSEDST